MISTAKMSVFLSIIVISTTTAFAGFITITGGNEPATNNILTGAQWNPRIIYMTVNKDDNGTIISPKIHESFLSQYAAVGIPDTITCFYVELPSRIIIDAQQGALLYQPECFYFNRSFFVDGLNYTLNFNSMTKPIPYIYCRLTAEDNKQIILSFGDQPKECSVNSLPAEIKELMQKLFPKSH